MRKTPCYAVPKNALRTAIVSIGCLLAVFWETNISLFGAVPPAQVTLATKIPPDLDTITLSRTTEVRGKEMDVSVLWKDCNGKDFTTPKADLRSDGRGLKIEVTEWTKCVMVAHISIDPDAPAGTDLFRVVVGSVPEGMAAFEILDVGPGPIPPGLDPQVDLMWKVLPERTVEDNFGHRVRSLFYCVEIVLGNNSGYDLQIASIGFLLPQATGIPKHPIPTNGYLATRSTLVWGQQIYWRNAVQHGLSALGPLLTGGIPFFKLAGPRSTYSTIVSIITNPFAKGFELVAPDETVGQLERLDEQTLRDSLIVANNTQIRTVTFISKESVRIPDHSNGKDPLVAMAALGEMVLVGDKIQHINRIRVVATPVAGVPSATSVRPDTITQGESQELIISGSLLQSAKVSAPAGFTVTNTKVDDKGTTITLTLAVASSVAPGNYSLTITTPGGASTIPVKVVAPVVSLDHSDLTFPSQSAGETSSGLTVILKNSGDADLTGITLALAGANADDFKESHTCGATLAPGATCSITITFAPTAKGDRSANLTITDNASGSPQSVTLKGTS